jgi:hypothetical protein
VKDCSQCSIPRRSDRAVGANQPAYGPERAINEMIDPQSERSGGLFCSLQLDELHSNLTTLQQVAPTDIIKPTD